MEIQNLESADKQNQIGKTINRVGVSNIDFARTAHIHEKVRNIDSKKLFNDFGTIISEHSALIGLKGEIDLINKRDVSEMIRTKYLNLSLEEIHQAFKMERRGELGTITEHFQLINTIYVSTVLDKFRDWLKETRVKNNFPISKLDQKKDIQDSEKKELINNGLKECFEYYIKNQDIEVGRMWVYDHLYDLDLLPTDIETKKQVYDLAISRVKRRYKNFKPITYAEKQSLKHKLHQIESGIYNDEFKVEAKKISIMKFFGSLVDSNKTIEKFFI